VFINRFVIWIKKPGDGFILDRRGAITCWASVLLVMWVIGWAYVSAAIAGTLPETTDPALRQSDLVKAQWWMIAGLLGLVQTIFGAFLIYIVSGVKENVRRLFSLHDLVLTTDTHEKLDHSQLCAICRKAEIEIGHGGGK
jgi:hypothetical protein